MKLYNISIFLFTVLVCEMRATGTYWNKINGRGLCDNKWVKRISVILHFKIRSLNFFVPGLSYYRLGSLSMFLYSTKLKSPFNILHVGPSISKYISIDKMNCFRSALLFGQYILINVYIWFSILISQDNILPSLSFLSSFITTPWWMLKRIATPHDALYPLFHKLKLSPKSFHLNTF